MAYFVYMIGNTYNNLYVGVSYRPELRLKEHNSRRGSVFTKSGDYRIVFKEEYKTLSEARKREIQIKKWSRKKKNDLIKIYEQGLPTKLTKQ